MKGKEQTHAVQTTAPDFLRLSARRYYYKPLAAFFNAFHLRAYHDSGMQLASPVLDVGCFDGTFGVLLTDALGVSPRMTGIEINAAVLQRAGQTARRRYKAMLHAGAAELPFPDRSFQTVLFNASLFAIDPGLSTALREARRVLDVGGQLCVTVSTDLLSRCYWVARFLERVGLPGLARRYTRSMDRRLMISHSFTAEQWISLLEEHDLPVKQAFGFFPPELAIYWSYLAWTPWRAFGLAKLIPGAGLRNILSRFYVRAFRERYERAGRMTDPRESTYLWIRAVREN